MTAKTTLDAVVTLATDQITCCQVAEPILGLRATQTLDGLLSHSGHERQPTKRLNTSQNAAVEAAVRESLVCLWGPPGTGKTETIVEVICALQEFYADARILVTAPTHNAVDNAMRRYVSRLREIPIRSRQQPSPLRVSTDVSLGGSLLV